MDHHQEVLDFQRVTVDGERATDVIEERNDLRARVHHTRRVRWCESCGCRINPPQSTVRVYGYAHEGERPYRVFVCTECAERAFDVREALDRKPVYDTPELRARVQAILNHYGLD